MKRSHVGRIGDLFILCTIEWICDIRCVPIVEKTRAHKYERHGGVSNQEANKHALNVDIQGSHGHNRSKQGVKDATMKGMNTIQREGWACRVIENKG